MIVKKYLIILNNHTMISINLFEYIWACYFVTMSQCKRPTATHRILTTVWSGRVNFSHFISCLADVSSLTFEGEAADGNMMSNVKVEWRCPYFHDDQIYILNNWTLETTSVWIILSNWMLLCYFSIQIYVSMWLTEAKKRNGRQKKRKKAQDII